MRWGRRRACTAAGRWLSWVSYISPEGLGPWRDVRTFQSLEKAVSSNLSFKSGLKMARFEDIALFVRTADLGSLSAAARLLDVSPAVASLGLKRLERDLD